MRTQLRFGIPAYGYPGTGVWENLAALDAGTAVIMDPADGPGAAVDPRYRDTVAAAASRGLRVFGYLTVDYGRRSAAALADELERYRDWYRPDGILLDQAPASISSNAAIAEIVSRIRAHGLALAINPGQPDIDPEDAAISDHVINFEGPWSTYRRTRFPGWVRDFASARFWHLVYEVADARAMRSVAARAAREHAGMVYITDATMPNPWERLPRYWDEERSLVSSSTRSA